MALATDYISGEVKTKQTFTYGKFVTSMNTGRHYGTVASFFTYWTGPNWSDGQWNEIDVEIVASMELDHNQSPYSTNLIYGSGTNYHMEEHVYEPMSDIFDTYHTYEIEWTPDSVKWFVDGELKRTATDTPGTRFMNKDQHLMMNFWTPTWSPWNLGMNDWDMPWYVFYDYVEVYSYDESTGEFVFEWRDDFDLLNLSRWEVSNYWTFGGNSTMFMKGQVTCAGGDLILTMQKEAHAANEVPQEEGFYGSTFL